MLKVIGAIIGYSALYGLACGAVHSALFAARNVIKFPLLVLVTTTICALAYYLSARALMTRLSAREVQRLVLQLFRDLVLLLAGLSPITLFLALTIVRPDPSSLGEYPLFLAFNVGLIAACGTLALSRQIKKLVLHHRLSRSVSAALVGCWLLFTLGVGGQCAWYLRPFFGVATVPAAFMLGAEPDYRGATNFFEAVAHLIVPPPLPKDYTKSSER